MDPSRRILVRFWLLHMAVCAVLWGWTLAVALGLGFKDRSTWTAFDHFQATVVPALASGLTIPGRLILDGASSGYVAIGVMMLNSLFWAIVLTAILSGVRHRAAIR